MVPVRLRHIRENCSLPSLHFDAILLGRIHMGCQIFFLNFPNISQWPLKVGGRALWMHLLSNIFHFHAVSGNKFTEQQIGTPSSLGNLGSDTVTYDYRLLGSWITTSSLVWLWDSLRHITQMSKMLQKTLVNQTSAWSKVINYISAKIKLEGF